MQKMSKNAKKKPKNAKMDALFLNIFRHSRVGGGGGGGKCIKTTFCIFLHHMNNLIGGGVVGMRKK